MSNFFKDAYQDANGVWRWKSNDQVPFNDMLESAGIDELTRRNCQVARDQDTAAFLAEYIERNRNREPSREELSEMRAAFGPGETVVNVITGRKIHL